VMPMKYLPSRVSLSLRGQLKRRERGFVPGVDGTTLRAARTAGSSERHGHARDHVPNRGFGFFPGRDVALGVGGEPDAMRQHRNR